MHRRLALGLCLLVAAACVGDEDATTTSVGTLIPGAHGEEIERVSGFLVEELGSDPAVESMLIAWELGYDAEQLLSLGTDGNTLRPDGTIHRQGEAIAPNEGRRGVITLPGDLAGLRALGGSLALGDVTGAVKGCWPGTDAVINVLGYLGLGYSVDDVTAIITALALGVCPDSGFIEEPARGLECSYVTIGDEILQPVQSSEQCLTLIRDDAGLVTTTTTGAASTTSAGTETTRSASPGVIAEYRGQAEFTLVAFLPQGRPGENTCFTTPDAEMTVRDDGTLTLAISWTEWVHQVNQGQGCRDYPDFRSVTEGTWSGSSFTASIADPIHANASTTPQFSGELSGGFAIVQTDLVYEGTGVNYVRVTLSMALEEVDDG